MVKRVISGPPASMASSASMTPLTTQRDHEPSLLSLKEENQRVLAELSKLMSSMGQGNATNKNPTPAETKVELAINKATKIELKDPEAYAAPFVSFLSENPTVFHVVDYFAKKLADAGYTKVWVFWRE